MTPRQLYREDLAREGFLPDPAQQQAVDLLQALYERLHANVAPPTFWQRLLGRRPPMQEGLYLWGGPGRGKTYLMDRFFATLEFDAKRRIHFHRFMLAVHEALDELPKTPDPLEIIAGRWADGCQVLCIDEFHVNDVADAMLLSGLLNALFARGVVLVATSNSAPDDLYRDGLQRERFLPAIQLLKTHTRVFEMAGDDDFRLTHLRHNGTYGVFADHATGDAWLEVRMQELAPLDRRQAVDLRLAGRVVSAQSVAEDVAWIRFDELCRKPRSTRDYLELAREFHTVLLAHVPVLSEDLDEAARRFIHLIDALYDHNVKLVVAAAAQPNYLYTGRRLRDAFERTASRLSEMAGEAYLKLPHRAD